MRLNHVIGLTVLVSGISFKFPFTHKVSATSGQSLGLMDSAFAVDKPKPEQPWTWRQFGVEVGAGAAGGAVGGAVCAAWGTPGMAAGAAAGAAGGAVAGGVTYAAKVAVGGADIRLAIPAQALDY